MNIPALTLEAIKKLVPKRKKDSHKGDNGKILIVGGCLEYFGSPILSAMGALRSGADNTFLIVPECNFQITRSYWPEFIVRSYSGEALSIKDMSLILEMAEDCDVVLIGPGLGKREQTKEALIELLSKIDKPLLLDAEAILSWNMYKEFRSQEVIVTPHQNELRRMMGDLFQEDELPEAISAFSRLYNVNILLKGTVDYIASRKGELGRNDTGNEGMTKGGTGDVLAGVTASFLAQGLKPFAAMYVGAHIVGKAGDDLLQKKGYGFLAHEVADEVAEVLQKLRN